MDLVDHSQEIFNRVLNDHANFAFQLQFDEIKGISMSALRATTLLNGQAIYIGIKG